MENNLKYVTYSLRLILMFVILANFHGVAFASGPTTEKLQSTNVVYIYFPIITSTGSTNQSLFSTCTDGNKNVDNYLVDNNQWNKIVVDQANQPFSQCLHLDSAKPLSVGWKWSWPNLQGQVKSYPSIVYGWKPWRTTTTDIHLPVQLSKMGSFVADFDTSVSGQEVIYNTSFDLWITSTNPPSPETITHEVMIWVVDKSEYTYGSSYLHLGRFNIDGEEFDIHISQSSGFIVFHKVNPMTIGQISIDHLLNILVDKGIISGSDYLADIEFGNELYSGSGETTIRTYSITPGPK